MYSSGLRLLFCSLALWSVTPSVQAARIKIQLPENFAQLYLKREFQPLQDACSDKQEVSRSSLKLPGRLNHLSEGVKFWKSKTASQNLAHFQTMKVPGLGGPTVGDVFKVLHDNGSCLPFIIGGAVRDQFLNRVPNDADVEVDCNIDTLMELCTAKWGAKNCQHTPGSHIAHIGNTTISKDPSLDVMDLASTSSTFYVPVSDLEYTVNAMAYDTNGNDVIIDLTGTGVLDACKKLIRIPSIDGSMASWDLWLEDNHAVLFRFWKLRSKGLNAYNNETRDYIISHAKFEMEVNPAMFAKFYCHNAFNSHYNTTQKKCLVSKTNCEKGLENSAAYSQVLAQDFGDGDYWSKVLYPVVLPMEDECKKH